MATLFVSDLHLDERRPAITRLFLSFLRDRAREAEGLYILGDLFEVWIGDDDDSALAGTVRSALLAASSETSVFFMAGNRDFLVGERFVRDTGIHLLRDPTVVDLYGSATLLMHGDTLCTDDQEYQRWRAMVREPAWQSRFLSLPLEERRVLAAGVRGISESRIARKPEVIMDVNPDALVEALRTHPVNRIIHGHTHRLDVHGLDVDGRVIQRIVLGDWYQRGSVLRVDAGGCYLEDLRAG